ncbi:phage minor capsid protein [Secundilactobacillus pentosiphilus]|uniref:Phage minor capsid protein n=1 Tax=Secundilactobacillus pentosiphilus TaxID=1714682 RepID=A0A1Z5IYV0_9LACO|nr:phage scaffolding protein [Secundilactobacillus pentosiphilus]GAX06816.1 phage minor capsid protein [Secundilactobacillus pentosiphilus]
MKRSELTDLGLNDEQVEGVMKLNNADISPLKSQLTSAEQERDSANSQLTEHEKQLTALKKSAGDNDELKDQISQLQKENKESKTKFEAELAQTQKDNAINLALRDANARDAKAVLPFIDQDTVKLDENGKLTGLTEQLENLKGDHDYLFDTSANPDDPDDGSNGTNQSTIKVTQGGNPGTGSNNGKPDIASMSYDEVVANLQQANQ